MELRKRKKKGEIEMKGKKKDDMRERGDGNKKEEMRIYIH